MNDQTTAGAQNAQDAQSQKLQLQKIYIKDLSVETPNSPAVFTDAWKPQLNIEIHTSNNALSASVYEIGLTLTLTARSGEQIGYLIELTQAGVFTIGGFEGETLQQMLGAYCPNILFPYAREAVDSLLVRAGFPPLHLAPVNFDAIYQQHRTAAREKPTAAQH